MSEHLKNDIKYMGQALMEAQIAFDKEEVPIGALIVSSDMEILAKAHNYKEKKFNPCGHAEIIVIKKASQKLKNWRLLGCTLYVTLEPCLMCLAAMVQARIDRLVFGAYDLKGGALSLNYPIYKDQRLNHRFSVLGGIKQTECSDMISNFFKIRRGQ